MNLGTQARLIGFIQVQRLALSDSVSLETLVKFKDWLSSGTLDEVTLS